MGENAGGMGKLDKRSYGQESVSATLRDTSHTSYSQYTNQLFDEYPYKYILFGVYRMLAEYGVESEGVRFTDK